MEEEDFKGLGDYLAALKRHKVKMIMTLLVILTCSTSVAFLLPSIYQSTAIILIEQQEIPQDLVRTTVTSYADQRIQVISQRVMTRSNLSKIIEKFGLLKIKLKKEGLVSVLESMRENINLKMISAEVIDPRSGAAKQATIAFSLSFTDNSPKLAQQVANELVSLYLDENLKRRAKVAQETTSFLTYEAKKLNAEISETEAKLATFKETRATSLPELKQLNMQVFDRTEQRVLEIDRRIGTLAERKIYLQSELAQIPSYISTEFAPGAFGSGMAERLKALETEYVSVSARYSSNHPDVVKIRNEIDALKREVGGDIDNNDLQIQLDNTRLEFLELEKQYSAEHPDVIELQAVIENLEAKIEEHPVQPRIKPDDRQTNNPAYIQLRAQFVSTDFEIDALQKERLDTLNKLTEYEKRLTATPQAEREYNELIRDYKNAQTKYQEVKAKQAEAEMAQALEQSRKSERFTLIEPPLRPEKPVKPNRVAILFLGFIFSIAGAVALVVIMESLDHSIHSPRELALVTGSAPLVVIPFIETPADLRKRLLYRRKLLIASSLIVIGAIIIFHFFIKPLDVAWFVFQRRLNLI